MFSLYIYINAAVCGSLTCLTYYVLYFIGEGKFIEIITKSRHDPYIILA